MARGRSALLLLATLAQARNLKGREVGEDPVRSTSPRVDPVSTSFYVDAAHAVQPLGCRSSCLEQRAMMFGTAVACGLACDMVGGYRLISRLSGGKLLALGAQLRGKAPEARSEAEGGPKESVQNRSPRQHRQDRLGLARASPAWLGSTLLALLATAAALGSSRARGPSARGRRSSGAGRQSSGACSPKESFRCSRASVSDRSTSRGSSSGRESLSSSTDSTEVKDHSESDREADDKLDPEQTKVASTSERAMCRQCTEPWGRVKKESHRRKVSRGGEARMLRQQSTPTPAAFKRNFENETGNLLKYGTGSFVRERRQQYEERAGFHRLASEIWEATESGQTKD
mmetsp:Transcript_58274/g.170393  ORF Transcript_58274/g.170393 Transcript_58274/m.170393 type:complete len:344 (+) Transcript_58274:59-1090(+)